MCPQSSQWVCCAARPTSRPFPGRQAPTKTITRRASSPSPPNCTPSRAPCITGRSRQQQRPQLARPADLGRHEGVGRRLVCGRTAAVRSPEGRAPARSHDGSDRRPASQACLRLVVGRLHQAPESPLLARGPARLRRRLVRRRVSPSHGPPGALRASVCVLVVGQSAKLQYNDEGLCAKSGYAYMFMCSRTMFMITSFVNKQTNPKADFTKSETKRARREQTNKQAVFVRVQRTGSRKIK